MVGKPGASTDDKGQINQDITVITQSHNIPSDKIRNLIQGSLDLLSVDPIPTRVVVDDIKVFLDSRGELGISCEVTVW